MSSLSPGDTRELARDLELYHAGLEWTLIMSLPPLPEKPRVYAFDGRSIERPEQAVAIWENLRTASDLVVDYRRGDEKRTLHFRIVDGA